jgi:hypothetical protein
MAERVPLIFNTSAQQIQEVGLSDEINVGIVSALAYSSANLINTPLTLASTSFNYIMYGPVAISGIGTVIVGAGVSYAIL